MGIFGYATGSPATCDDDISKSLQGRYKVPRLVPLPVYGTLYLYNYKVP